MQMLNYDLIGLTQGQTIEFENGLYAFQRAVARTEEEKGFWDQKVFDAQPEWIQELMLSNKLHLIHSELVEALEDMRKDPKALSAKIPPFTAIEDELADALIRLLGLGQRLGANIAGAALAKAMFNHGRPHKHGKRF